MKKIILLLILSLFLAGCGSNVNKTEAYQYISNLSDNIPNGTYSVLEKHVTVSRGTVVSFVLKDNDENRYYIAYLPGGLSENKETINYLLKIIPGDIVIFSEDTKLLELVEETE